MIMPSLLCPTCSLALQGPPQTGKTKTFCPNPGYVRFTTISDFEKSKNLNQFGLSKG